MPSRAHHLLWVSLLCAGCLSSVDLDLPEPGEAQTLVLVTDADAPQGWVFVAEAGRWVGPDGQPAKLALEASPHLALSYRVPAQTLQVEPGRLRFVPLEQEGRALPTPARVHRRELSASAPWAPVEISEAELARLRLPAFDFDMCAAAGGCLATAQATECSLPCPSGPVAAAAVPPRFTPTTGWSPLPGVTRPDGGWVHAPPIPERLVCPQGQMRRPEETECRPVTPCPAPGAWPVDLPPDTVYVRAGASGDGSASAPLGSLTQGLLQATASGTVVFEGEFRLEEVLEQAPAALPQVSLRGVCPPRSTLNAAGRTHFLDGFQFEDLTLQLGDVLELGGDVVRHLRRVELRGASLGVRGGRVRIEHSSLRPRDAAVVISARGRLELVGSYVYGLYGLHLYDGGDVIVRDSLLEGDRSGDGHGISCGGGGGIVDVQRFLIRGYTGSGIGVSRCEGIRAVEGHVLDVDNFGIRIRPCDVLADGTEACLEAPSPGAPVVTASISRVWVDAGHSAIKVEDGALHMNKAVLRSGWTGIHVSARPEFPAQANLQEVVVLGVARDAIELLGTPGAERTAHIEDVLLIRGEQIETFRTTMTSVFFDVDIRRLHIVGGPVTGFELGCGAGHIEDLVVTDVLGDGIRLSPTGVLDIERVEVQRARLGAVRIFPEEPSAVGGHDACTTYVPQPSPSTRIRDLRVIGGDDHARGLVVCGSGPTRVDRVQIEGVQVGLHLQDGLDGLRGGNAAGTAYGVSAPADVDLTRVITNLEVQGEVERRDQPGGCP